MAKLESEGLTESSEAAVDAFLAVERDIQSRRAVLDAVSRETNKRAQRALARAKARPVRDLASLTDRSEAELVAQLRDGADPGERMRAGLLLGRTEVSRGAVERLLAEFGTASRPTQEDILLAIGCSADPRVMALLNSWLRDPRTRGEALRHVTCRLAQNAGIDDACLAELITLTRDASPTLARDATQALSLLRRTNPEVRELLTNLAVTSPEPEVRSRACASLTSDSPEGLRVALMCARDPAPCVRRSAVSAIGDACVTNHSVELASVLVDIGVADGDAEVRLKALGGLRWVARVCGEKWGSNPDWLALRQRLEACAPSASDQERDRIREVLTALEK